jgi:hypothetical protein
MALPSNRKPRYLPFMQDPRFMAMGLARLAEQRWIEPDDALPEYFHNKLAQRSALGAGAYQSLPGSLAAQRELRSLLLAHLTTDHAVDYIADGARLILPACQMHWDLAGDELDTEPLWDASLWVQDDICLLQDSPEGYRLTAASLCAASFWRLEEKIGNTLDGIHTPVPGFAEQLAPQLNRFFCAHRSRAPGLAWQLVGSGSGQTQPARGTRQPGECR